MGLDILGGLAVVELVNVGGVGVMGVRACGWVGNTYRKYQSQSHWRAWADAGQKLRSRHQIYVMMGNRR